jgi:hypothetical protein
MTELLDLRSQILGSFREMPGLSLRLDQAAKLFALDQETCEVVLQELAATGQLRLDAERQYRQAD